MKEINKAIKAYGDLNIVNAHNRLTLEIIAKAKEFDVPIFQNSEIVNSFIHLQNFDKIPNELIEIFDWLNISEIKAQNSF